MSPQSLRTFLSGTRFVAATVMKCTARELPHRGTTSFGHLANAIRAKTEAVGAAVINPSSPNSPNDDATRRGCVHRY